MIVVVALPRVSDGEPSFHPFGQTPCVACSLWVWLGSESLGRVVSGQASPMCMQCLERHRGLGALTSDEPLEALSDLKADE